MRVPWAEIIATRFDPRLPCCGLMFVCALLAGCITLPPDTTKSTLIPTSRGVAASKSPGSGANPQLEAAIRKRAVEPPRRDAGRPVGAARAVATTRPVATSDPKSTPRRPSSSNIIQATATTDGVPLPAVSHANDLTKVAASTDPNITPVEVDYVEPVPTAPHPVNLAGVLELVDSQNPQVAFARERIQEANAQQLRANVLWLPTLRAGVNYNHHEEAIQAVEGRVFNTNRSAFYTGMGAAVPGAASPVLPGLAAQFHLTDAIFQPRIAEQVACSRKASASAATNDMLLEAALAYLELQRADAELAIARETLTNAQQLERVTGDYARTGQGLPSDHDRALAELSVRRNDVSRAEEAIKVASARLAQLLSVDVRNQLQPEESAPVPLELVFETATDADLVAHGLQHRPEIAENRHLVGEAIERLQRDRYAPLIPSILLGASYGNFSGGLGSNLANSNGRFDGDAVAYWEIRNLGFGEQAARAESGSRLEQARFREMAALDRIAREIVEASTQVQARRGQISVAKEGVQSALSSHRRNIERMKNAQGLPIEVLQSVQALAQARREYLRSVIDFNRAQFSLQRALGKPIEP